MGMLFVSGTTMEIIRPTRKLSRISQKLIFFFCTSFSEKLCKHVIKPSKWEKIF